MLQAWTSGPYTTPSEGTSRHRQVDQSKERLDPRVDQMDQFTEPQEPRVDRMERSTEPHLLAGSRMSIQKACIPARQELRAQLMLLTQISPRH